MVFGIRILESLPQAPVGLANANLHIRSVKDTPVFRTSCSALSADVEKTLVRKLQCSGSLAKTSVSDI